MATATKKQAASTIPEGTSTLLDQAIAATKQTTPTQTKQLLEVLTENALKGTVKWDRNVIKTLNNAIASIDQVISTQLATIMHSSEYNRLEGSWRGLHYLVKNTSTGAHMKIKLLHLTKSELRRDLEKSGEFDQSYLFKEVYENQFGMPGGQPFGAMLGNYEFSNHPEDISLLKDIAGVAAAAFCPFISSTDASLFGFDKWTELSTPRDLEKIFDTQEYAAWRSFRQADDSRFVTLTLPRVLARLPYGQHTKPVNDFNYEELAAYHNSDQTSLEHEDYCWMNAAFVLGQRLTHAFSEYGWCTAIRGAEGGGKVDDLPLHVFTSDDGDLDYTCPTEVGITDRREAELSKLGFLPLCHYKDTDYAVFFSAATCQKPKKYDTAAATANASISARLPYLMATSRFAHYLKVMARDKIGSFMETDDVETWLNRWILQYVNANAQAKQDLKAKYPLAEAKVKVEPVPGKPGCYQAVAWLRPWLQLEELTASMRLVAQIPEMD